VRSARGTSSFPPASEKGPQVHSKRRVVKTASKISALWPSSSDMENADPAELPRLPSFATKRTYVFSRDAHSVGIAFMRVKLDAWADIVAAPHMSLPVGVQCRQRTAVCTCAPEVIYSASLLLQRRSRSASPAKAGVSVARRRLQRHEHLPLTQPSQVHMVLHNGVTAQETPAPLVAAQRSDWQCGAACWSEPDPAPGSGR
jgi:hypothetical protein